MPDDTPPMAAPAPLHTMTDDPRKLREMIALALRQAEELFVPTVAVGLAGKEGDMMLPEILSFLESSLRIEDRIFRMTRERAVIFLADVDFKQAHEIMERLLHTFLNHFPQKDPSEIDLGFFEITSQTFDLQVKDLLPALFLAEAPSRVA